MRDAVAEDHPPVLGRPLPFPRSRDVDDLVPGETPPVAGSKLAEGHPPCFEREDSSLRPRGIFERPEGDEEDRAKSNPPDVERHETPRR